MDFKKAIALEDIKGLGKTAPIYARKGDKINVALYTHSFEGKRIYLAENKGEKFIVNETKIKVL